jgi:hypothetical protein
VTSPTAIVQEPTTDLAPGDSVDEIWEMVESMASEDPPGLGK